MHWNYSKLREKIRVTCGTQDAFAEKLGIGRVSLNLRLNNKAEFSQEEIFKACEILGIAIKDIPAYFFTKLNTKGGDSMASLRTSEPEAKKQESPQLMEAKELEQLQELTSMEDKQRICSALAPLLRLTRNLYDLAYLHYDPETETVKATFLNGHTKTANVALDSGTAMIRDIIQQIV